MVIKKKKKRLKDGQTPSFVSVYLQVFVFGHDGDLVAIHTEDFSLQVDQLPLTHFHIVTGLQVVFTLFAYKHMHTLF